MKKYNIRVEVKNYGYNNSSHTSEKQFRILMSEFRKACHSSGIIKEMKKREYYESPSEKKRRLKKERELNLLKQKMKESFIANNYSYEKSKKTKKTKPNNNAAR